MAHKPGFTLPCIPQYIIQRGKDVHSIRTAVNQELARISQVISAD